MSRLILWVACASVCILATGQAVIAQPRTSTKTERPNAETIERIHRARIEGLKELVSEHEKFSYAIHSLILPAGAVQGYNFPIPVARVRYEAVPLFDFDIDEPRPEAKQVIRDLARQFVGDKALAKIAVVGHTDSVGQDDYNYKLSLRRALAVAKLLRSFGVSSNKLLVVGLGEAHPVANNETEEGRALNRRVEFFLSTISEAITPSIKGAKVDPNLRNTHEPGCRNGTGPDCGRSTIKEFPVQVINERGELRATGEKIPADVNAAQQVTEILERQHMPMEPGTRPHPN